MKYTFEYIREHGMLLYEYIRGSHCHGTNTPTSDVDTGGVYILPDETRLGLGSDYQEIIEDEKHDNCWYELNRFCELLLKSNPTVIESLFVDDEFVIYTHPVFKILRDNRETFITKECFNPFTGYSIAQIKKAHGLNKMIVQPIVERKEPIDFCYVTAGNDTIDVTTWLMSQGVSENEISLAKLNHAKDSYAVFQYPGGFCNPGANDVHVNNLPKGLTSIGVLFFNKDAYSKHCKDYKRYKEWEKHRNPIRYQTNIDKNYDAKNMSECMRLINMGIEIAKFGVVNVNRKGIDAELLLAIKNHEFSYEEILEMCEKQKDEMYQYMQISTIPDKPDYEKLNRILLKIRRMFDGYQQVKESIKNV